MTDIMNHQNLLMIRRNVKVWDSLSFVMCAVGILASYLLNGLLVETISRKDGFKFYLSILFFPILFNCVFAFVMVIVTRAKNVLLPNRSGTRSLSPSVNLAAFHPARICGFCSLFYVAGMFFSNISLRYISYPMQVIMKSAKPIPVMLFSIIGAGCRYSKRKYSTVLLIVFGTASFLYTTENKVRDNSGLGIALLLLSLMSDGAVALFQERIRKLGSVDSFELMLAINSWAALLIGVIVTFSGELTELFYFCIGDTEFVLHLFLLGITSALGQNFIFISICKYGPLVCSLITTTRKFFAVLLSIAIFKHTMSTYKWLSMFAVFTGLVLEALFPK